MKAANITTAIAAILWLALFYMGRGLTYGVYAHGPGVFPNSGQFDYYVLFPICMAAGLMLVAWVTNALGRGFRVLLTFSACAILFLFPYLLPYTGGV
jgi:hypothetical protein